MKEAINTKFSQEGNFASCVNFQIINVQLSEKREESLINTQVTIQMGKTKKKEQKAKEIRAGITVVESQSEKNITQVQGNGTALAKKINANATAVATNMTISATSNAYKTLSDKVGITPATGLSDFIYYTELQTATEV